MSRCVCCINSVVEIALMCPASLSQMCINIANEQLQHYFNEHIFSWELDECKRENIDCESITYTSNYPIVQLFLEVKIHLAYAFYFWHLM